MSRVGWAWSDSEEWLVGSVLTRVEAVGCQEAESWESNMTEAFHVGMLKKGEGGSRNEPGPEHAGWGEESELDSEEALVSTECNLM